MEEEEIDNYDSKKRLGLYKQVNTLVQRYAKLNIKHYSGATLTEIRKELIGLNASVKEYLGLADSAHLKADRLKKTTRYQLQAGLEGSVASRVMISNFETVNEAELSSQIEAIKKRYKHLSDTIDATLEAIKQDISTLNKEKQNVN